MRFVRYFFIFSFFTALCCGQQAFAQKKKKEVKKETVGEIKWISFTEAVELNKKQPKKIMIDVYTEWCGWCKTMDRTTFKNPDVVKYINEYFYAVKFDAETKDTIRFENKVFVSTDASNKKAPHQMAVALLNGQMGYPTSVYMDEKLSIISPVAGYQSVQNIEPILRFVAEEKYKTQKWEEFSKDFKGNFKE